MRFDPARELTYRSSLVFAPTENHDLAERVPDVERVVLRTDRNTVSDAANAEGYTPDTRRFVFDGTAYAATATFGG